MVNIPSTVPEFKELIDRSFEKYADSHDRSNLKAYLVESNLEIPPNLPGFNEWNSIGGRWYASHNNKGNYFIMNATNSRIWILYSLAPVNISDKSVSTWVSLNKGLDRCWFSRSNLESFGKKNEWEEKGIGLKYENTVSSYDESFKFSLKAWYGNSKDKEIIDIFEKAKAKFTTTSIRWRDLEAGRTSMRSEWYNDGKITVNYSNSVSEILQSIAEIASKYHDSLKEAEQNRDRKREAFEFEFKQKIDLDMYSEALFKGTGNLKLWMSEIESCEGFKRFSGVDLHTGDRIFLDIAEDYAYMTVPGNGCVNAVPRFAVVQGVNALGETKIFYKGSEIFND